MTLKLLIKDNWALMLGSLIGVIVANILWIEYK